MVYVRNSLYPHKGLRARQQKAEEFTNSNKYELH